MTFMLEFKEKLKAFYGKYSTYLLPVLKFLLALAVFININSMLGFMSQLNSIFVVLILALVCALLPVKSMLVLVFVLIIGHCYAVGIEVAAFAVVLLLLLLILFLRFSAKDTLGILLTPIAFSLNVPCALPIGYGLLGSPASAFSAVCGVVIYYFVAMVQEKASLLQGMEPSEITKKLQILLDGLIQNPAMWMTVIAFTAVAILVYCLRRLSANYSWQLAIISGGAAYLLIMTGGGFFLDLNNSIILLCIQTVVSCLLMMGLRYFVFHVDYTRTEFLQYEDDEYYYYVKAVPKMTITEQKRFIKTISEEDPNDPPTQRKAKPEPKQKRIVPQRPETELEKKLEKSLEDL